MPGARAGLGALLALSFALVAGPSLTFAASQVKVIERSVDSGSGSLGKNILGKEVDRRHSHEAHDKPSKFDLIVGQYEDMSDNDSILSKRLTVATFGSDVSPKVEPSGKERTTVERNPSEENAGRVSKLFPCKNETSSVSCIKEIDEMLRRASTVDTLQLTEYVQIAKKKKANSEEEAKHLQNVDNTTNLLDNIHRFSRNHIVKIKLWDDLLSPRESRTFFGTIFQRKSSFLTGFGLGFLAFGLKKLLFPLFIGAQIIKSILIALFLPSIIGSIGKIVGKGVTSFAQSSQSPQQVMEENYEFKENQDLYNDDYMMRQPLGTLPASTMYDESMLQTKAPEITSRYSFVDPRRTPMGNLADRYYTRHVVNPNMKRQDFKVFHEIPTSSLLLTNYDPFYSPLLSRLDAVFSRLGHNNEGCREYAVCAMYRSPARYAPYSNLVSAQLSRELNELRKPSSDNPDVLRFFHYMKAAKDGQDGLRCEDIYGSCENAQDDQTIKQNQAMLATYQDIDKLVHARKL